MQFDVTDLRLFAATAAEGNLTRAARLRHLSLAAASARIKALESQAGLALLYREARGVRLTPAGEAFLHHARALLRQADQLQADLQDYGGGLRGHVRVFANTTAVTDFLPEVLPAFLNANPRVNVELQEKPNAEIARGVLDSRADLGIVAGQVDTLGLRAIHFSTDRLVLVVPRDHRFARRRRIAFAETLDEDAVGMHPGSTLQAFLAQVTEALGRPLKLRIQLSSFDAMCRMVGAGVGIGIVPESAARRNLGPMKLVQIELTDPWRVRERHVLVREGEALPAYAQSLVDTLVAHYRG
ncbi:LysR substrate-binding domain-containing protein [Ramlibacter tataouinensis]|uniref:Transcriptional regulator, LysR family-like protein n=1 Tax=Ramlibacter tataouinensis (strain ATCC BAA-407 / DSM 14655 / LMG 21543 / TTB310) TaxID=365046 RepID=F5Y666_RAMTT|nr:LysR substrate-binding domain-containing protein [Ramlibacter tataouinensis]AEG92752.1 transcriptional regulator, LysR family-like protein [Ramlibacter tataouinensis TTB310]